MTPRIPESISTWLVDWRLVTIVENTMTIGGALTAELESTRLVPTV